MVMFLMALCLSLFGLAVCAWRLERPLAAAAGEQRVRPRPERYPSKSRRSSSATSFEPAPAAALPAVPIEVLLLQIERHVRLEHAAAESFLTHDVRVPAQPHHSPLVH